MRYLGVPHRELFLQKVARSIPYKGFAIEVRTFQIRGSGRWTLDLLISRRGALRSFSGPATYASEAAAIEACRQFGQNIIDGRVNNLSVSDLD